RAAHAAPRRGRRRTSRGTSVRRRADGHRSEGGGCQAPAHRGDRRLRREEEESYPVPLLPAGGLLVIRHVSYLRAAGWGARSEVRRPRRPFHGIFATRAASMVALV